MRYSATHNVLSVVLMFGAAVSTSCATPANRTTPVPAAALHDPLMGLTFNPSNKGFEPASADLSRRCPNLVNARYTQQLWVFAEAQGEGQRYLIVAGRFMPRRAGDQPVENALGTLLQIDGESCTLIGPGAEIFLMPEAYEDSVPVSVRSALGKDAARRFVAAYGGAANLGTAMRKAGKTVSTLPSTLQTAFATIPGLPR